MTMGEAVAGVASERMTWDQICAQYAGQWVLLIDLDWIDDVDLELRSAVVVTHSEDRRDTLGGMKSIPEQIELAHFFIPKAEP
ncbi:MAG: hypothetical protein IT384_18835 [Deltaproteobacteria bacterium]|nr:hypothetical protein [Deltaproteobacteria bacterium]